MVGLPYPNPSDPELQERMRFMDRQAASSAAGAGGAGAGSGAGAGAVAGSAGAAGSAAATPAAPAAAQGGMRQVPPPAQHPAHAEQQQHAGTALKLEDGREYYSNLCMKAVNQVGARAMHAGCSCPQDPTRSDLQQGRGACKYHGSMSRCASACAGVRSLHSPPAILRVCAVHWARDSAPRRLGLGSLGGCQVWRLLPLVVVQRSSCCWCL